VILYLKNGDLVNASIDTGRARQALSLSEALGKIPAEPEYGEICFHEAPDEQLACMYTAHSVPSLPAARAEGVASRDVLSELFDSHFNGLIELTLEGHVNYLIFELGKVTRGYLCGSRERPLAERAARALGNADGVGQLLRRFPLNPELPLQALPTLIKAYRELMTALVCRLVEGGRVSAPAIAEHARTTLLPKHPSLAGFTQDVAGQFDPVCSPAELSRDIAAWATETVWAGMDIESGAPAELLQGVTRDRRHMFQSAGFFEHIPWKLEW
jgi:hypothetical protein